MTLHHLAVRSEWEAAQRQGEYRRSTIGTSLAAEGFIHLCFDEQLPGVAARYYRGRDDLVLLEIDPERLGAEVRVEDLAGIGESFPHLYGPLPVSAVASATPASVDLEGRLIT